jgi:hypothetical protein
MQQRKTARAVLVIFTFDQAISDRVIATGTQRSDFTRQELAAHRARRRFDLIPLIGVGEELDGERARIDANEPCSE